MIPNPKLFELTVNFVQQMSQPQASPQKLLLDDRCVLIYIIVRYFRAFRCFFIHLVTNPLCLKEPIGRRTCLNCLDILIPAIDLLLPFSITPFVSRLYDSAVPNRMQIGWPTEQYDRTIITTRSERRPVCIGQCISPTRCTSIFRLNCSSSCDNPPVFSFS